MIKNNVQELDFCVPYITTVCPVNRAFLFEMFRQLMFLFFFFCKVFIQVLDINDNSPKFTHGLYARMVSENVALGTTVEVVQANDADTGRNGQVSYKIGNGNAAGNGNLLVANHDSWNVFPIISVELTLRPLSFYLSVSFQAEGLWAIIQIKSGVLIVDCLTVWLSPQ